MNLELTPRLALSYGATFVSGFIIAMWCKEPGQYEHPRERQKPGFWLSIPSSAGSRADPNAAPTNLGLKIIGRSPYDRAATCVVNTDGLTISAKHNFASIFGPLKDTYKLRRILAAADLNRLEAITSAEAGQFKNCLDGPLIHYGDDR